MNSFWPVLLAMVCALAGSAGQLFFKTGSASVGASLSSWLVNWRVMTGFFLYGVSAVGFIIALKHGRLSLLYPVIATSYVWVTLLSSWVLGRRSQGSTGSASPSSFPASSSSSGEGEACETRALQ